MQPLPKKIMQPLHKKVMQPPQTKQKIMQPLHTEIMQTLNQKESRNLSAQKKSCNLSKKKPASSPHKNSRNLSTKHCENHKTLPWEHHISSQMCKIALLKSTDKVFKKKVWRLHDLFVEGLRDFFYYCHCCHYCTFFTFSLLLERVIWHNWQSMWCSQGSILRFMQFY